MKNNKAKDYKNSIKSDPLTNSIKMELNRITLSFTGSCKDLEKPFLEDYFKNSLKQVRIAFIIGIVFFAAFGAIDAVLVPEMKNVLWIIRYGFICPYALFLLIFSFFSGFKKNIQLYTASLLTLCGFAIILLMVLIEPTLENFFYYSSLVFVLIFGYTFFKARFVWASITGWVIIAFHEIAVIWLIDTPFLIFIIQNFIFIGINIFGMIVCYSMEYSTRRNFFITYLLEKEKGKVAAVNIELEKRVLERTFQLVKEKEFSNTIIQASPAFIVAINGDGKLLMMSKSMLNALGYTKKEAIGSDFITKFVPEGGREIFSGIFSKITNEHKSTFNENRVLTKDSRELLVEWHCQPILDNDSKLDFFIGIGTDITERKKAEEKLKYLSFHDRLTGLYNRSYIEEEIARLDKKRQLPLSLAMGDVNALKLINDAFDYKEGDRLLVKIAKILKKCSQEEDILARWGGDEFVILLPKTTEEDAIKLVERVREACERTTDQKIPASISIGVSTKTRKAQNIQDIIKEAEDRMYQRKLIENKSIQSSIISSLEATLWERSHETEEHGRRLKELALKLGRVARLAPSELDELALLSALHDIGKIGIKDSILIKPGKLTKKEWQIMKGHSEIGYKIAQSSPQLLKIADGILYHHEWWDGTGYPHGLTGENIPVISRILAIADAYDVMTNNRVYKKAVTKKEAIKELKRYSGTQFDPRLVEKFIEILE
jgi:diguanylate cyclase (GGDEF)-like protein/PAS domain S-box-containing protein